MRYGARGALENGGSTSNARAGIGAGAAGQQRPAPGGLEPRWHWAPPAVLFADVGVQPGRRCGRRPAAVPAKQAHHRPPPAHAHAHPAQAQAQAQPPPPPREPPPPPPPPTEGAAFPIERIAGADDGRKLPHHIGTNTGPVRKVRCVRSSKSRSSIVPSRASSNFWDL